MDEANARDMCEKNGSTLRSYEGGRAASLILRSGQPILISVGASTAKVLTSRPIFGWRLPKVIVSQHIEGWEPTFNTLDSLRRDACGSLVLDGLLSLLSRCQSIDELRLAWPALKNPIAVAALESVGAS